MNRTQRIAFNKLFGFDYSKFEKMTDEEYEADKDFEEEKYLRNRSDYSKCYKKVYS